MTNQDDLAKIIEHELNTNKKAAGLEIASGLSYFLALVWLGSFGASLAREVYGASFYQDWRSPLPGNAGDFAFLVLAGFNIIAGKYLSHRAQLERNKDLASAIIKYSKD